jgi:NTE family protein
VAARALVLAGGGVAGVAWELGVLAGLRDGAPELGAILEAEVIVGTSAGSAVGAQITSGVELETLVARQLDARSREIAVEVDLLGLLMSMQRAIKGAGSPQEAGRRLGALALDASTVSESERLAVIRSRLPQPEWPRRRLLIPAVDALSGELVVFDRESGVELADAVAASCAIPGVWPAVTIAGRRYIDGAARSGTNADLAAGAERVLILTPTLPGAPPLLAGDLDAEIAALTPGEAFVINADEVAIAAFGTNPLSPATRPAAVASGRAIGGAVASAVAAFW